MIERLKQIRKENPNFDKELVNEFANKMENLLLVMIDGKEFDNHIGTKEVAKLAEKFITDNKGVHIGFRWNYDDVINIARNYINLDDAPFYPTDLWVWANVKYGDIGHLITDSQTVIRYAISELTDDDFPFYDASQRAYCWLKKHIENENI